MARARRQHHRGVAVKSGEVCLDLLPAIVSQPVKDVVGLRDERDRAVERQAAQRQVERVLEIAGLEQPLGAFGIVDGRDRPGLARRILARHPQPFLLQIARNDDGGHEAGDSDARNGSGSRDHSRAPPPPQVAPDERVVANVHEPGDDLGQRTCPSVALRARIRRKWLEHRSVRQDDAAAQGRGEAFARIDRAGGRYVGLAIHDQCHDTSAHIALSALLHEGVDLGLHVGRARRVR